MGTLNKKIYIIENFLPDLNYYLNEIHKINLYKLDEYNSKFNLKQNWPGERSNALHLESPFLFHLILQNLKQKIDFLKHFKIDLYLHLRKEESVFKDWIHKDEQDYSFLIYLNKTNLNSGTYLFDENNQIVSDIKYVENRFVIYNSSYNHSAYGHFGNNSQNGRLTLNGFLNITD